MLPNIAGFNTAALTVLYHLSISLKKNQRNTPVTEELEAFLFVHFVENRVSLFYLEGKAISLSTLKPE